MEFTCEVFSPASQLISNSTCRYVNLILYHECWVISFNDAQKKFSKRGENQVFPFQTFSLQLESN